MSAAGILLVLASAILHVAWNAIGKSERPSAGFFGIALGCGTIVMSPLLFVFADVIRELPLDLWPMLGLTSAFQAVYYVSLAAAYRGGDMSLAYPLTRSTTVLFMAGMSFVISGCGMSGTAHVAGLACIVCGSLVLPLRTVTDFRAGLYFTRSCFFAICAAAGTTGCMLTDEFTLRRIVECGHLSNMDAVLLYAPLQSAATVVGLGLWTLSRREERAQFRRVLQYSKFRVALVGLGSYASYGLLLASRPYVHNLSYSVALRQLSIPLGTAIGIFLLKEPRYVMKSAGAAAITAGVVLVALA